MGNAIAKQSPIYCLAAITFQVLQILIINKLLTFSNVTGKVRYFPAHPSTPNIRHQTHQTPDTSDTLQLSSPWDDLNGTANAKPPSVQPKPTKTTKAKMPPTRMERTPKPTNHLKTTQWPKRPTPKWNPTTATSVYITSPNRPMAPLHLAPTTRKRPRSENDSCHRYVRFYRPRSASIARSIPSCRPSSLRR